MGDVIKFPRASYHVRMRMTLLDRVLEVVYYRLGMWAALGALHGKYGSPGEGDFIEVPLYKQE